MTGANEQGGELLGISVPVHRALTEPILLGGAPRAIAIMNGTLAGELQPALVRRAPAGLLSKIETPIVSSSLRIRN